MYGEHGTDPHPHQRDERDHGDWQTYDQRTWDDYYDRSIPRTYHDDESRKRRRSPSPGDRDRFEPRPRYGDDHDAHSRSFEYGSHARPPYPYSSPVSRGGRHPPDPWKMDYPASLRQFAEWFRANFPREATEEDDLDRASERNTGKRSRDGIRMRWEVYKKEHSGALLEKMFHHHKKSPWFLEKYDPSPEWSNMRSRVRKQAWNGRAERVLNELKEGKYDPVLNIGPSSDSTKPCVDTMDDIEENGNVKKEDDNKDKPVAGVTKPLRDDEIGVEPEVNQMAIRTIPPDIGRKHIEEALSSVPGVAYLALGEPLQKRNYYRMGWIKFREGTDMELALRQVGEKKIEGFKLQVSHIVSPTVGRVRTAPEVASTPPRVEKDLQQAKELVTILEDDYCALKSFEDGAPEPVINSDMRQAEHDGQSVAAAGETVSSQDASIAEKKNFDSVPEIEKGSDVIEKRAEMLAEEFQRLESQPANESEGMAFDLSYRKNLISLDLHLAYLRAAFNTCYYCAAVCDHAEELQRKCPKHIRKPCPTDIKDASSMDLHAPESKDDEKNRLNTRERDRQDRSDDRWSDWMDSRIALLVSRSEVDPTNYGGRNYDKALSQAVKDHIKQEDEGRYRCKSCNKLFKATAFVEKHVSNKHPELVTQLDELTIFNNFALDPHRIQLLSHTPNVSFGSSHTRGASTGGARSMRDTYIPGTNGFEGDQGQRRLGDRLSEPSHFANLPPKPPASMGEREFYDDRRRARSNTGPPPPPPEAKEDPRANGGRRVSYHDMDDVAEGDVELTY